MSWTGFLPAAEQELGDRFRAQGHLILPVEDRAALDAIRTRLVELACDHLGCPAPADPGDFLNGIGALVPVERLNALRLHVFNGMQATPWLRPACFALARRTLEIIVGNELAMQRRVNLSIQLPGDDSSLLPVHADVWSGDSPFEVVLWVPWVDCFASKSMYLLPPGPAERLQGEMHRFAARSAEDLYQAIAPDLLWLDVPYGHFLLFNQNLPHGNRVNQEPEARWTSNCRFKGVFTPYADKKLGEFFEPITLRPASRIGLDYDYPGGFAGGAA